MKQKMDLNASSTIHIVSYDLDCICNTDTGKHVFRF